MKENNILKIKIIKIIFALIFCFTIPFFIFNLLNITYSKYKINENISVFGINLKGLCSKEIEDKLNSFEENLKKDLLITLKYNDLTWTFTQKDFEVKSNVHIVLEKKQRKEYFESLFTKQRLIKKIKQMGFDNKVAVNYLLTGIDKKISKIAEKIKIEPTPPQPKYDFINEKFNILPAKIGYGLDEEHLYKELVNKLSKTNKIIINLKTKIIHSNYTEQDIIKSTLKQSQFSTNYSSSNSNRKNNIKMAVNKLSEVEILPNEIFSFNSIVGKRTIENGYKEANIIKNGEFVKGLGGGVCQVSTTLYNALLLANIEITQSHKHSLPVSYVPPGLDAMVSWGTHDLQFKNTTNLPIRIIGAADGNKITFKIFGDTNPENYKIKTRGEIIRTILPENNLIISDKDKLYSDKIKYKGEFFTLKSAKNGYEAISYIDYYKDNKLVKSKQLRKGIYDAQRGIVYEGCEEKPVYTDLEENLNVILNDLEFHNSKLLN